LLLALFLIDLAAGLFVFLPLVGRRNAGVKFYRLVLMISAALALCAAGAHFLAHQRELALGDLAPVVLTVLLWIAMPYPKRLIYRASMIAVGLAYVGAAVFSFDAAMSPASFSWSIFGALASIALLGSVTLAMTLGHWYLVVRGMAIDPLKRLTIATLFAAALRLVVVIAALIAGASVYTDIFWWMRAGWGLLGPLALYPMVWGTVRIRSTMAATGILYVDVVAVVIGEVLGGWLASTAHLPV
jgi:hypothetical protein